MAGLAVDDRDGIARRHVYESRLPPVYSHPHHCRHRQRARRIAECDRDQIGMWIDRIDSDVSRLLHQGL